MAFCELALVFVHLRPSSSSCAKASTWRPFFLDWKYCLLFSFYWFTANSLANLLGGDKEIRTLDPLRARQVLSQLSYIPMISVFFFWFFLKNQFKYQWFLFFSFLSVGRERTLSPSLERRWSSRTFRYGYLVTTSPQLLTLPSTAASTRVRSQASGIANFHGVTGGVYKTRERIHRGILIHDY